jgi:protein-tyrosine-phosphatase
VGEPESSPLPRSVLFACGQNSVRSPMAAALARQMCAGRFKVGSVGVRKGEPDWFAVAAMAEVGLDMAEHQPKTFEDVDDDEGLDADLIITLAPEAHHKALELAPRLPATVEYWPTADPTAVEGNREQRLDAYRAVRDQLMERIRGRFGAPPGGNE